MTAQSKRTKNEADAVLLDVVVLKRYSESTYCCDEYTRCDGTREYSPTVVLLRLVLGVLREDKFPLKYSIFDQSEQAHGNVLVTVHSARNYHCGGS